MRHGRQDAFKHAVLVLFLGAISLLASATLSAQDSGQADGGADGGGSVREPPIDGELLDCRAVDCFQRSMCNRRVLAAINRIKTTASEVPANQSPDITHRHITAQIERQERLRSFVAPECRPPRSACDRLPLGLAGACRSLGRFLEDAEARAKPAASPEWTLPRFAPPILIDNGDGTRWLRGRWDGWLFFDDNRVVRLGLRITGLVRHDHVGAAEGYVKACSDQGMVMGSIKDGVLQLPRREPLDFGSRMVLWRSVSLDGDYDDLEGVVLLETTPGREIQHGLVWLSRTLTRADSPPEFTDYSCQDKELLDRRKKIWRPDQ